MKRNFLSLLRSVAARRGLDYDAGQVTSPEAGAIAEALTECARILWDYYPWPYTCYYANTGNNLQGWAAWDRLLNAWTEEPLAARAAGRTPGKAEFLIQAGDNVSIISGGAVLPDGIHATGHNIWYLFQTAPPVFSRADYAAGTYYSTGDAVFYGASSWRASDSGTGGDLGTPGAVDSSWVEQTVPIELESAILAGVQAWFAVTDGQPVAMRVLQGAMTDRLADALRYLTNTQGQYGGGTPAHR